MNRLNTVETAERRPDNCANARDTETAEPNNLQGQATINAARTKKLGLIYRNVDRQQIKLARQAYDALAPLNNISWHSYREQLLKLCKEEEKDHRGFLPDFTAHHTPDTASVSDAAKLMAVKRVAQYMQGEAMPKGKDYLHYQRSCFYAAGLVEEFQTEIAKAWSEFSIRDLANLDYTAVVKVQIAQGGKTLVG